MLILPQKIPYFTPFRSLPPSISAASRILQPFIFPGRSLDLLHRMDMDEETKRDLLIIIIIYIYIYIIKKKHMKRKRKRDKISTISGHEYTLGLLEGKDGECDDLLRMSRESFIRLCRHFRAKGWLKNSTHMSVEEKMAIFLMMIGGNQRFVEVKRMFQHSTQTIHKYFHEVLDKMLGFASEVIVPDPNPDVAVDNMGLRGVFKGAIGVLDGILVHAIAPPDKHDLYKRLDGECYQNVMAICDFNMVFTFLVAGWEGIAYDSQILHESLADPSTKFPYPESDKYYLCDTEYRHTRGFMTPYRGVRDHLEDFQRRRARNDKEKFNHAHAQLRNVIERAFGVLKARFPILEKMAPYDLVIQRNITISCFAIHNFIRKEGLSDRFFTECDQVEILSVNGYEQEDDQDDKDESREEGRGNDCGNENGAFYLDGWDDVDGDVDGDEDEEDGEDDDVDEEVLSDAAEEQYMINLRDEITMELMQNEDC